MLRLSRLALLLSLALLVRPAAAQEADTLTAEDGWGRALTAPAAATQASYGDWQAGGVNALAATARVDGTFDRLAGILRVTLGAAALYDAAVLARVQRRQTLRVGLAVDLL